MGKKLLLNSVVADMYREYCGGSDRFDNSAIDGLSPSTDEALRPREGKKLLWVT
ncbi:hypothetical protein STEG23_003418, partial [Scotinomys teguina]